jgi:hypothetical protein
MSEIWMNKLGTVVVAIEDHQGVSTQVLVVHGDMLGWRLSDGG